jgi:hypothetical protein
MCLIKHHRYTPRAVTTDTFDRTLGGSQNQSGRRGEDNSLFLSVMKHDSPLVQFIA